MNKPHDTPEALAFPWATLVVVCATVLFSGDAIWPAHLELSRVAVEAGEWWRLWTASMVHFNMAHLFWNSLVVLIAGGFVERRFPGKIRTYYVMAPAVIGTVVYFCRPDIDVFRGLSGVGAGVATILAIQLIRGSEQLLGLGLFTLLIAKVGIETVAPHLSVSGFADSLLVTVPSAHVAGVFVSIVMVARSATPIGTVDRCSEQADTVRGQSVRKVERSARGSVLRPLPRRTAQAPTHYQTTEPQSHE